MPLRDLPRRRYIGRILVFLLATERSPVPLFGECATHPTELTNSAIWGRIAVALDA